MNAATDDHKETPLIWAARTGQAAACEALLAGKADRSRLDDRKRTAAEYARWNGFDKLAERLAVEVKASKKSDKSGAL